MIRLLIIVTLVLAGPVMAQPNKKEAETFFRAGEKAFHAGQYSMASQAFEEAYKRLPNPAIAFSAAQAYRLQYFVDKSPRNLKRAVELYRAYLGAVKAGGRRGDAAANLAELEPILQRIEAESETPLDTSSPPAPVTKLLITADVEGAKVQVNGATAAAMPFAQEVKPGKYRIVVKVPGYFPYDETREVFEGQFRVVEVELEPQPATLLVKTDSSAAVRVDGRISGLTSKLPAGKHWVTIRQRGKKVIAREVTLKLGQELKIDAPLESTLQRRLSYVVFGVSGTSILTSGLFFLAAAGSNSKAKDLLDKRDESALTLEELDRYLDLRDQRDRRLQYGFILGGLGAAIGTAGFLMYWLDTPDAPERPSGGPALTPMAGQNSVGAVLSGRF